MRCGHTRRLSHCFPREYILGRFHACGSTQKKLAMGNGKPLPSLSESTVLIDDTKHVMFSVILVLALQGQPQTQTSYSEPFLR